MGCIYSLTFPNGKQYIGMTRHSLSKRLTVHRESVRRGITYAVCRAWRKYGDPVAKVLAFVENTELRETERRAIKVFNTMVPNGYNLLPGGEGGFVSAETRRKMSVAGKGKSKSEEHRKNIGLGQIGRPGTWLGKKHSPEHIAKRTSAHIGSKRSPEFKQKMSELAKGRVMSEETRKRISETMKQVRASRFWSRTSKGEI